MITEQSGRKCVVPRRGLRVGAFGDKFRKERERRGFTLDQVSNVTKINARMLKAIEDEHFDLLPGGVFNKGFVRAYAKHLGLNDEESVAEYLAALREAQVDAETAAWQREAPAQGRDVAAQSGKTNGKKIRVEPKPALPAVKVSQNKPVPEKIRPAIKTEPLPAQTRESTPAPVPSAQKYPAADLTLGPTSPRSDSIPWRVPAVVLAVIIVAALLWNRHSRGVHADVANARHATEPTTVAAANNSATVAPASAPTTRAATPPSSSSTAASNPPATSSPQPVANREVTQNTSSAVAQKPNGAPDKLVSENVKADSAAVNHESSNHKISAAVPAKNAPPVFTLRIRASESSWIAVSADGQPAIQETLIAPAGTAIRATHEITVRVGNAAGVSFQINGKEIPPQGGEAEVKTITFDAQGLK